MSLSRGGINKIVNLGLTPACPFAEHLRARLTDGRECRCPQTESITPRSNVAKQDGPSEFRESLQFCHIFSLNHGDLRGEAAPSRWITIGRKLKCAREAYENSIHSRLNLHARH